MVDDGTKRQTKQRIQQNTYIPNQLVCLLRFVHNFRVSVLAFLLNFEKNVMIRLWARDRALYSIVNLCGGA